MYIRRWVLRSGTINWLRHFAHPSSNFREGEKSEIDVDFDMVAFESPWFRNGATSEGQKILSISDWSLSLWMSSWKWAEPNQWVPTTQPCILRLCWNVLGWCIMGLRRKPQVKTATGSRNKLGRHYEILCFILTKPYTMTRPWWHKH